MPRSSKTRNYSGSVIKRSLVINGKKAVRYDARKRYTDANGLQRQKFKRCRSDAEARVQLKNFETEIEREMSGLKPRDHTFLELCDYFETEHLKPAVFAGDRVVAGYRQNTRDLKTYVQDFRAFFGCKPLRTVNYEDVRRFAVKIATEPIKRPGSTKLPAAATINRKLSCLRRIFNVGIQLQWLDVNPFKLGKRLIDPRAEVPRERVLSFDEEARLLAACEGPDNYEYKRGGKIVNVTRDINPRAHLKPAIILAIESGMRKKEIFTTSRKQVDLERMVIELNAKQTKALKRRFIPISDRLAAALRQLFAGRILRADEPIFGGAVNFDRAFATACRRANISDLKFHDLRHTAATWMDEAGISEAARRNAIGHVSERIAQRYINPSPDGLEASRVKMNEFRQKLEERRDKEKGAALP